MSVESLSIVTQSAESHEAGRSSGERLFDHFSGPPKVVVAYLSINHDQPAFLRGLRAAIGNAVPVIGASSQGVMARKYVQERGYFAGVMGLGGDSVHVSAAAVTDIFEDTADKGRALGEALCGDLGVSPDAAILLYDPLCGADMDPFLAGLGDVLNCPVVGGGAGHLYGPMQTTYQYFGDEVFSAGAVAIAIGGDFTIEAGTTTGCSPVGIEMTVTRSDGSWLLELDGSPALEVWKEVAGSGNPDVDHTAALAIGVPLDDAAAPDDYLVRAAFGSDDETGGVMLQSGIAAGTNVMLHHRTTQDVLAGTARMGGDLTGRLAGKTVKAVLAFECGARSEPFLGAKQTLEENIALQDEVGPDAEWLGMFAWGEVYTYGLRPVFSNYTYPMLVIAE